MTIDEQKNELGAMVLELRELRLTIVCLEEKLTKAGKQLWPAVQFARRVTEKGVLAITDEHRQAFEAVDDYPSASEIRDMAAKLEAAKERKRQIEERLALC